MINVIFGEEDALGVMQDRLGVGRRGRSERLIFVGPIWTLLQCSGPEVIQNQFCGYSDKWGSLGCIDYSFGYKRINDNKGNCTRSVSHN